jgi:hypothetical protein
MSSKKKGDLIVSSVLLAECVQIYNISTNMRKRLF